MAGSLATILLLGLLINELFKKTGLPGLLGMIILGAVIGPYGLNLLHQDMINISADLRRIALIIILLRAGFGINKSALKKNGVVAMKLGSLPVIIEGFFITLAAIIFLNFSLVQGGMLGFIIAAVSPAVVVPSMLKLIENGMGSKKGIPTLILAGASLDDVFAITIFSAFLGIYSGANMNLGIQLLNIPISIVLGIMVGAIIGFILVKLFKRYHIEDTRKLLLILGLAILLTELESLLKPNIAIAALLGVMAIGFILIGLLGRSIGVMISLFGTDFNWKERLFCVISYVPKATVQAAMGAVPLSMGVESGDTILALAVLSIIITAPLGAIGINYSAKRLL